MTKPISPDNRSPYSPPESAQAEEAVTWFARLRSGRMTAQEQAAFQTWRSRSPAHEAAWQEIGALWNEPELAAAAGEMEQAVVPTAGARRRAWLSVRVAAAAAMAALAVVAVLYLAEVPLRWQADYMTSVGQRHTLTLADQSTITLNTDSAVAWSYGMDRRDIRLLKGEAFFRVQPDVKRPFVVKHEGVTAKAVGTAFLVRERQGRIQVTVIEGVVAVHTGQADVQSLTATAGQQILITAEGARVSSVNAALAAAWTTGRLVFDNVPFSEVVAEIGRYHPGYIGLWNPALAQLRVSGSYNLADTSHILTTLTQTLPVHMNRLTDRLVVFR